ncbi:MAG: DUF6364 family protein [Prevotellaceae bacterium]|jgi:hypothetical protein|nr:DUF6364 family protein [Prevotellaceae bacterium]
MATTTLNLPIDIGVAERIKKYAIRHQTSVSSITENFFALITTISKTDESEVSALVKSFSIEDIKVPANFDYKVELEKAKDEKYL